MTPSAISLASNLNPSRVGDFVTFTAPVVGEPDAPPTGAVTLTIDGTEFATVDLTAGVPTFGTSQLQPGSHTITATYHGDETYAASTDTITQVTKAQTFTRLTSSDLDGVSPFGQGFTVTVETSGTLLMPDVGLIELYDRSILVGSAPFTNSPVEFHLQGLHGGVHVLQGVYSGSDVAFASGSEQIQHVVTALATEVTATVGPDSTIDVTVRAPEPEDAALGSSRHGVTGPTGTVVVTEDDQPVATADLGDDGRASVRLVLPAGVHDLVVRYEGTTDYEPSEANLTISVPGTTPASAPTSAPTPPRELPATGSDTRPLVALGAIALALAAARLVWPTRRSAHQSSPD